MIAQNKSVVIVAKMLFASPRLTTEGFERLWEMGELNRSIEFAATLPGSGNFSPRMNSTR